MPVHLEVKDHSITYHVKELPDRESGTFQFQPTTITTVRTGTLFFFASEGKWNAHGRDIPDDFQWPSGMPLAGYTSHAGNTGPLALLRLVDTVTSGYCGLPFHKFHYVHNLVRCAHKAGHTQRPFPAPGPCAIDCSPVVVISDVRISMPANLSSGG